MNKLPLFILTALACTNGVITQGETKPASTDADSQAPSSADEDAAGTDDSDGGTSQDESEPEVEADTDSGEPVEVTDDGQDSGLVEPGVEEDPADEEEVTLEGYLATYCEAFAVPCMGYPSVETCVDAMMVAHFEGCTVTDVDALAECDAWVATIGCSETSWLPACDDFITCG